MPTFSVIAFDRFIEPSIAKPSSGEGKDKPSADRKVVPPRAFLSPTLYPTPQTTPIPDTPSSFTLSPYVINHKRRGPPRPAVQTVELKDALRQNGFTVGNKPGEGSETKREENKLDDEIRVKDEYSTIAERVEGNHEHGALTERRKIGEEYKQNETGWIAGVLREIDSNCEEGGGKIPTVEDASKTHSTLTEYLTSRETVADCVPPDVENGIRSNRIRKIPIAGWNKVKRCEQNEHYEYNVAEDENCWKSPNSGGEAGEVSQRSPADIDCTPRTNRSDFFDAEDDLSTEDAALQQSENYNSRMQCELDALRTKISLEIEKRMRAEAVLSVWQAQWQDTVEKFLSVGLSLPSMGIDSATLPEKTGLVDYIDHVCGELTVARLVADAVGRGLLRAELEQEIETLIDGKNREISRLRDKLQYYELVNREMSQRNQEAIEIARRQRRVQKKRERWIWGSLAITITIGGTVLAYSYLPWSGMRVWMPSICTQSDSHGTVPDSVEI